MIKLVPICNEIYLVNRTSLFSKNKPWRILVSNENEWENLKKFLKKFNYTWKSGRNLDDGLVISDFPSYVGFLPGDDGISYNYNYFPSGINFNKHTINSNILKNK